MMRMLFVLLFAAGAAFVAAHIGRMIGKRRWRRDRVRQFRARWDRLRAVKANWPIWRYVRSLLSVAGFRIEPETLAFACLVMAAPGGLYGYATFHSAAMGLLFGAMSGSLPFLLAVFFFHRRQKEMAGRMLPMLHIFLGVYAGQRNIRQCLQQATPLLPPALRGEFQLLTNALHTGIAFDAACIAFGKRVGHPFAEDFADLLVTAAEKGENITDSLIHLINRVQQAKFNEEMERTELIEIKYGTMAVIALTVFLVQYNIRLGENPLTGENPIRAFYTETAGGQTVVFFVALVQFISLIASFYVGRRKM